MFAVIKAAGEKHDHLPQVSVCVCSFVFDPLILLSQSGDPSARKRQHSTRFVSLHLPFEVFAFVQRDYIRVRKRNVRWLTYPLQTITNSLLEGITSPGFLEGGRTSNPKETHNIKQSPLCANQIVLIFLLITLQLLT